MEKKQSCFGDIEFCGICEVSYRKEEKEWREINIKLMLEETNKCPCNGSEELCGKCESLYEEIKELKKMNF